MNLIISSVSAFVLFAAGMYATSYAEAAGCFNTPEGINTYNCYFALAWAGFIALQIIANLIILAFHPFGPFGDFFSDLHDFFVDQVIPRLRGRKIAKRHESLLDNTGVCMEDRGYMITVEAIFRHVRAVERLILQEKYLFAEQPKRFKRDRTPIEQEPGDEGI
jgi:hypothetical protein